MRHLLQYSVSTRFIPEYNPLSFFIKVWTGVRLRYGRRKRGRLRGCGLCSGRQKRVTGLFGSLNRFDGSRLFEGFDSFRLVFSRLERLLFFPFKDFLHGFQV